MVASFVVASEAVDSKRGVERERLERFEIIDGVANSALSVGHDDRLGGDSGEVGVLGVERDGVGTESDGGEEYDGERERQ